MCVPGVHMCVCLLSKKHVIVLQLRTLMFVPQMNVYESVYGCTSARAACTVSVVYTCVFHVHTHVCLNCAHVSELPM